MKNIQWKTFGFFVCGLAAYLFLRWYMPHSEWADYQYVVYAAGVVGGAVFGLVAARFSTPPSGPTTQEKK